MDDKQKAKEEAFVKKFGFKLTDVRLGYSDAEQYFMDGTDAGFDAGLAHAQQWVDVNERLPAEAEDGRLCLCVAVFKYLGVRITTFDLKTRDWWISGRREDAPLVWMPIPPFTPKGEQQ